MKTFWIVLITVIITGGIIGGGGYYYLNSKSVKEKDDLQSQIDDLNAKIAAAQTALSTTSTGTTSITADATAGWKTYTNTKYGFTLTFTDKWQGYKIKDAGIEGDTYCANVPTTATASYPASKINYAGYAAPFCINVYTLAQWNAFNDDNPSLSTELTRNNTYVFSYSSWQDSPQDLRTSGLEKEVTSVAKSFKLTN